MTVSVWQEAKDAPVVEHRDVVIGAGLVGGWAATRLSALGRDVAIVDRAFPAAGASGRNAGFVLTAQRDPYPVLIDRVGRDTAREILTMVRQNVATMRRLADEHGVTTGPGPVRLAETAADRRELERWASALEQDGARVDIGGDDPFGAGYLASMRVEGDFVLQPARMAEALVSSSGATLYDHSEVYGIEADGPGMLVRSRRVTLRCERVWIATNGYSSRLHPYFASRVMPARGQIFVTAPTRRRFPSAAISHHGYFRQLDDGRLLVGGARAFFEREESTSEDRNTAELLAKLRAYTERWFPMVDAEPVRAWAGIQGFTADRRVMVGTLPDLPKVSFAVGLSGYGNGIGLVAAERMIEHALEGRDPGPLAASRLGA